MTKFENRKARFGKKSFMKKLLILNLAFLVLVFTSCDPSGGKSFYLTHNGEEVTELDCSMKDLNARVDVDQLEGYTGGDVEVQISILDENGNIRMDQYGAARFKKSTFEDEHFLNVDLNPSTTKIKTWDTQEKFNIFHTCRADVETTGAKTTIEFHYYEANGTDLKKVGYVDMLMIQNL